MNSCPSVPPRAAPPAHRPHYVLAVRVRDGGARVDGSVAVTFAPERPTRRLVFRLWADGPFSRFEGAHLDVADVRADGRVVRAVRPNATTLVVPLARPAGPSRAASASLRFTLVVPSHARDRISRGAGGVRLGSFFPLLAWETGRGWALDPPAGMPGETSTSPTADFDVRVAAPRGWRVVASGDPAGAGRWRARDVRDVAIVAGPFRELTGSVRAPRPVHVVVTYPRGARAAAVRVRAAALEALRRLSARYGAYAWRRYSVALFPDLGAEGIEYPTLVFVGARVIRPIVVHETAHQWFYSLVGNDQARDPWLDETLATWASRQLGATFRRARLLPRHLGSPMSYWVHHPALYFREVYDRGAAALATLGPPARVDCALRLYAAQQAYRVARPADLVAALQRLLPGAAAKLRRFGVRTG